MSKIKYIIFGLFLSAIFGLNSQACPLIDGLVDYNCDGKHQIAVTGDSIVYGTGDTENNNQGGYVLRLERTFKSSEVLNYGYPGITTNKLLAYYKKLFLKKPRDEQITQLGNSDIIIIDIGRNDYFNRNSSTLTATTVKRLTQFLSSELAKKFGTSPLFVTTILPLTKRKFDLGFVEQVNMVLLKIRSKSFPAYLRFDKLNKSLLGADGLHPTSAGYDALGNIAAKYIRNDAQTRSKKARKDADQDGIYDIFEQSKFGTSPIDSDTDADGLTDGEEVFTYFTDPLNADTDADGSPDGSEVTNGTDPKTAG